MQTLAVIKTGQKSVMMYVHTQKNALQCIHKHSRMRTYIYAIHMYIHKYIRTCIRTYVHTQLFTRSLSLLTYMCAVSLLTIVPVILSALCSRLAFSRDGRLLVSIAEDKTVAVSDWKSQRVIATTKGEPAVTHQIAAAGMLAVGSLLISLN